MRRPYVRFTIGRLMVAVAIVALALAAALMYFRSRSYRESSQRWAVSERLRLDIAAVWSRQAEELEGDPPNPDLEWSRNQARKAAAAAARAAELKRKYSRAAARPWLPVAPDPPDW